MCFVGQTYAATATYTNLVPTGSEIDGELTAKQVTFNGYQWYIIDDNSTAENAGSVTLLAADESFGTSVFSYNQSNNDYSSSIVKGVLDALTAAGGSFASVKDAIVDTELSDVGVSGAKLYLLSKSEANDLPSNILKANFDSSYRKWWLRSPGNYDDQAAFVYGDNGTIEQYTDRVSYTYGVRPALQLNLSSVSFSSETKAFTYPAVPTTGGEWGGSGTQNGSDLTQYEAAVYAAPVVSANGNTALTITNTHYPELINVSVVKIWSDDDDRDHYRPDAICITLTAAANSVSEEVWNHTLNAANADASDANRWTYTFDDMVKFYDGYQIAYTLAEDSGSCSSQVTKTAANCEISGGRWTNNSCTPFGLFDPNRQNSSPAEYNDESSCTTAGRTWVPATCADPSYTTQLDCEGASESWTAAYCAAE